MSGRFPQATAADPVPVIYVAGIGRSGSTLLNRALGTVDGLFAAGEMMHFFGRGMAANERCACGARLWRCPVWSRVARRLRASGRARDPARIDRFRHLVTEGRAVADAFLPWSASVSARDLSEYGAELTALYRTLREVTGARVLVDSSKNLSYAKILQETGAVRLHVVHLVRDSRGVTFSLGKRTRRPGPDAASEQLARRGPVAGSLLWTISNVLAEAIGSDAASYRRVRYHDFVAAPSATLRQILFGTDETIRVDGLPRVRREAIDLPVQHVIAGNPVRSLRGEIRLDEDVEWRDAMGAGTRHLVTTLTLPLLVRYGFLPLGAGGRNGARARRENGGPPARATELEADERAVLDEAADGGYSASP